jgi:hypothetical protein
MTEAPLSFLAARGFTLEFHVEDGRTWADLRSLSDPMLVIRRFSGGADVPAAARLAAERWCEERGAGRS